MNVHTIKDYANNNKQQESNVYSLNVDNVSVGTLTYINQTISFSFVDEKKIDEINILQASMLAMKNAYDEMLKKLPLWLKKNNFNLSEKIEITAIADGTKCPEVSCSVRCEPKADGKYSEVMAASILAKVARDRLMLEYDKKYPEYGYAKHKGYPTKAHREVCRKIGPSPIQRLSFKF